MNYGELLGKTIKEIKVIRPYKTEYSDDGFTDDKALQVIMTDGTVFNIYSKYGVYTGKSLEEYPECPPHIIKQKPYN